MTRPSVSVVICTRAEERWDALLGAIDSVRRQAVAPKEVIVVVDGNPRLLERARAALPDAIVVASAAESGLSGARNTGVAHARGDVVAFLDDDAKAAPDWLEHLADSYADERVAAAGGWVEPCWAEPRPAWFPDEFDWVVGSSYRGLPRETAAVRNLIGANMSFRREVFAAIGGFRADFGRIGDIPLGCEETELCIRVGRRWPDRLIVHVPAAGVVHAVPPARARVRYFVARCWGEGMSKAALARVAGGGPALSSERTYVARALPAAVGRGLADSFLGRRPGGIARALAVVVGLLATTAGFVLGGPLARLRGAS